jgi:hypothetical protein
MACAEGTLVRTDRKELTPVENLFEGAELHGERNAEPAIIDQPLQFAMRPCLRVRTKGGQELVCDGDHGLLSPGDEFIRACESLQQSICAREGVTTITSVRRVGLRRVVLIHARYAAAFETNGLLSHRSELDG